MTIAYLVNQYPSTSHSFIRREIRALEAVGLKVLRCSIRRSKDGYVDKSDAEEAARTEVLLESKVGLIASVVKAAFTRPGRLLKAASQVFWHARRSDRGIVPHLAYLAEASLLRDKLAAANATHLHAHFGTNSAIVARICNTLGGPPFSFTVHGPEEFDRAVVLGLPRLIESAEFVAAISQYGRSQLYRQVELKHWDKITIVRCGVEPALFASPITPIPETPRLVCVGRLHEQKGQFTLLSAVNLIVSRGQKVELVLAGDGPLRKALEERVETLGLQNSVRITGWITEQQVKDELRAARALVLPSFAEGLPVVIMEAFALGRPVLSSYVAGIPELVRPQENGWLVPAGDVERLAEAIQEILDTDPEKLQALGRAGREAVIQMHDVAKSASLLAQRFTSKGQNTEQHQPEALTTRTSTSYGS